MTSMTVEEALIIVEKLLEGGLTKVQEIVFRGSWQGKSYLDIAKEAGYDPGYVKDTGSKLWQILSEALGVRVLKHNFRSVLQRWSGSVLTQDSKLASEESMLQCDWGEAIDTTSFYGRVQELATLEQWVLQERSRLIVVLGLGGMGKTTLTAKLIKQILSTSEKQSLFDYCIWRSLRNAPLIEDTLVDLLQFLSTQQETALPETIDRKINLVLHYLKQYRCLIVLDNVETILDSERVGSYRAGYEGYGQLLRGITDGDHQSTVILTSREKPKGLALKEGKELPVRVLQLQGLHEEEGQKIFRAKGFVGSETQWNQLIEHYHGNPLALKIAATNIQELFDNDIAAFLEQGTTIFGDIWDLIDQQFSRLSALEQQIMYWLAVNRQWISFAELREDAVPLLPQRELLTALESLQQRSLIQKQLGTFTQPIN
jgi:GTPase SAR1 family protein